ncbi:restriction endonuclease subunit S [Pseudomonas sp. P5_109]|uniref:restriction endonuclease subunit S n=1 Tax=unclassified Pseudomonas TaxID=196821 RepID=UPI001CC09A48|nr:MULTISPECIES: restriction endonuclease subunit S [unclassified Pseudomonas]WPN30866.1 restriction endonuclease subunit S [Pseudomonas sp. P5_109]
MAVKPGYKQTEIGVIPVDWDVKRLGDLATVRDGTHQTPKYVASGVPFFSVEHVTSGDFANTKFISEKEHRFLTRSFKIEKGDILMTRIGSIGDCKLIDWDVRASFYVSLALLKVHGASAAFVAQYSNSAVFKKEIELHSLQSAIPKKINLGPISDVKISVPPLPEQHAIATALGDVDALLGALERLIAKKRDLKQAAMQQLLTGQTRLPGFHGKWEMKRIGDIAPLQRGFDLPNPSLRPGPYPVVYSNGVMNHHAQAQVQGPGVVTGRSGTIGNVTFVDGPFWPHNTALWVTSFRGNDPRYVFYLYTEINFERFATGSGVPTLNRNDVHSFEVAIPPCLEQTAIAAVLSDIDAELATLEQRLTKTRTLKQGMMQELLTGRTRLL